MPSRQVDAVLSGSEREVLTARSLGESYLIQQPVRTRCVCHVLCAIVKDDHRIEIVAVPVFRAGEVAQVFEIQSQIASLLFSGCACKPTRFCTHKGIPLADEQ